VSLPTRQQSVLNGIEYALAARDPDLADMFAVFTLLNRDDGPPRTERLHELAPLLAVAFLSAPDESAHDAADLAQDAVGRGVRAVIVSRGRQGCLMLGGGLVIEQPAVPARVVDTLGAGDALIAGVIAALLEGLESSHALERGAQAAAAACGHIGAWS